MRRNLPAFAPAAARFSGGRWRGGACFVSGGGVRPAAVRLLLWASAACSRRRAREREESGTVRKEGSGAAYL